MNYMNFFSKKKSERMHECEVKKIKLLFLMLFNNKTLSRCIWCGFAAFFRYYNNTRICIHIKALVQRIHAYEAVQCRICVVDRACRSSISEKQGELKWQQIVTVARTVLVRKSECIRIEHKHVYGTEKKWWTRV